MIVKTKKKPVEQKSLTDLVAKIVDVQRQRTIVIKSRTMQSNRIQAIVAGTLGYEPRLEEKKRKAIRKEAIAVIKRVLKGEQKHQLESIIKVTFIGIREFSKLLKGFDKQMEVLTKQLPVAKWVELPNQRGFSWIFLGSIIGECGDLNNYSNPAKVWRRLGCAPWTWNEKCLMGATWKSGREGKLPSEEWEKFGYCPRRRSVAYLVGKNIVLQNRGAYRKRYESMKANVKKQNPDYSAMRCDRHGMLCATKLLLKDLWVEWTRESRRRNPKAYSVPY